jgi:hypothetical protein
LNIDFNLFFTDPNMFKKQYVAEILETMKKEKEEKLRQRRTQKEKEKQEKRASKALKEQSRSSAAMEAVMTAIAAPPAPPTCMVVPPPSGEAHHEAIPISPRIGRVSNAQNTFTA